MHSDLRQLHIEKEILVYQIGKITDIAKEKGLWPYNDKFPESEYLEMINEKQAALDHVLKQIFDEELSTHGPAHFSPSNTWVWGGPTPSWGGSMTKDASIKAAEFFGFNNILYVYGPLNEEMMEIHRNCANVICHLGGNCRTAGAQALDDVQEAEELSRLAVKYPFIRGGVIDDMIGNCGTNYSQKTYKAMCAAIKKHNPGLELFGVVYSHELDNSRLADMADCIDRVILWVWSKQDLPFLDLHIEKCRAFFPGKKIMMGVFMFDYGLTSLPNSTAAMEFQLTKARKYLNEGKIQDVVILGDREIEKCPQTAQFLRCFFQKEFAMAWHPDLNS